MNHLVTFGDSRMKNSLQRLFHQALEFNLFDTIHLLDENDLPPDFREEFKDKLVFNLRGFGYWSWKPQVIAQTLQKLNDGDSLLYIDAGCHLNKAGFKRLQEYFHILSESKIDILAFQAKPPTPDISTLRHDGRRLFDQPNYEWIKGDLFDYFDVRDDKRYTHAQAIGAGVVFVKKSEQSLGFVREWQEIIKNDFSLLDDTLSKSSNLEGFKEHRHDQAIFSLLCLKYGVPTLSAYEYWYPKNNLNSGRMEPDWAALKDFPIHAKRDKDLGLVRNMVDGFKRRIVQGINFL